MVFDYRIIGIISQIIEQEEDLTLSEKINAEWALKKSVQNIAKLFAQIDDRYIKERIVDVEYVAEGREPA